MSKKYNVAVVGATGLVGQTFLKVLKERKFPVENLYLYASARSAGKVINWEGKDYTCLLYTSATGSEIKGVVTVNGGILKNYGTIEILGSDNMGVYRDNKSSYQDLGSGSNTSTVDEVIGTPTTSKSMGSVEIKVPNAVSVTTVTLNGVNTPITTCLLYTSLM